MDFLALFATQANCDEFSMPPQNSSLQSAYLNSLAPVFRLARV
jgi:hypothetical protein